MHKRGRCHLSDPQPRDEQLLRNAGLNGDLIECPLRKVPNIFTLSWVREG